MRSADLNDAALLLDTLHPAGRFTFQSFDDSKAKRGQLARLLHGTLIEHAKMLQALNDQGAGIFVTVNETDGQGREYANVTRVRALFVDLDGSPIDPVRFGPLMPHLTVESSPGRWHAYWLIDQCDLQDFKPVQRGLIARFGGDKSCVDLPRVMRLPGFWHLKGDPVQTKVVDVCERPSYSMSQVLEAFGWATAKDAEPKPERRQASSQSRAPATSSDQDLVDDLRDALQAIPIQDDDREFWIKLGHALKADAPQGLILWLEWSSRSTYYDAAGAMSTWETFHPNDIGYRFVFAEAKRCGWDPRQAPSVKRKRGSRPVPPGAAPPAANDAPATTAAMAPVDVTAVALLRRFEQIYGKKSVWDCEQSAEMPFAAFAALVGREPAKAWLEDSARRVKLLPEKKAPKPKNSEPSDPTKVGGLVDRYVLIYSTETVFDLRDRIELTLPSMRAYAGLKSVRDWIDHPKRRVVNVEEVIFDPRRDPADQSICNLWRGWPITPAAGSKDDQDLVRRWLGVLHYTCGESDALFNWILNWIAYPMQHPGTKMKTSVIMHGPEGSGKNTVWDAVRRIYGRYGRSITQTQLEGQWTDWMSAKLFIVGNEVLQRQEQLHQKGRIKTLVTESTVAIERKFLAGREEPNFVNLVFLSNEDTPLALDFDDRRQVVVWTPKPHPDGKQFYAGISEDSMPESAVRALYHHFLSLDLGSFGPHSEAIMTDAKREVITASLESHERFARQWVANELDLTCRPCRTQDLYRAYQHWCRLAGERFPKPDNKFGVKVKKIVPAKSCRYLVGHNVKQAMFYLPPGFPPPEGKAESTWLGEQHDFFTKALEEWKSAH